MISFPLRFPIVYGQKILVITSVNVVAISDIGSVVVLVEVIVVSFFGALPIDQSKIKHTQKLKEIPCRHFLENLPEKASIYAFIHLKLAGNLQEIN